MTLAPLLFLPLLFPCARAASRDDALFKRYATPLAETQVYFRWQSTTSGENLARAGGMTKELNQHFMNVKKDIAAGPGIYFADSELSSATYLPSTGGNLLEVHLPKGTPVIDISDVGKIQALTRAGVDVAALQAGTSASGPYVLRYTDDWYVGKNLTEKTRFEMYPSAANTSEQVMDVLTGVEHQSELSAARDQIHRQLLNTPAERRRELFARDPLHPLHLDALKPREVSALIDETIARGVRSYEMTQLLSYFAKDPRAVGRLAKADPATAGRLADVAVGFHYQRELGEPAEKALLKLAKVGGADDPARRARLLKLVYANLPSNNVIDRLSETRARVIPILRELQLTDEERAKIAAKLAVVFKFPDMHQSPAEEIKKVMAAARIDDPEFIRRVNALSTRAERLKRASSPSSIEDVVAGLREHDGYSQFARAYRQIASRVPNQMMDEAHHIYVTTHAAEYAGLFRGADDLAEAALYRTSLGEKTFPVMYEAALGAGPEARAKFVESCLTYPPCAQKLGGAVAADGGRVFAGVTDLDKIESTLGRLTKSDPTFAAPFADFKKAAAMTTPALSPSRCLQAIAKDLE